MITKIYAFSAKGNFCPFAPHNFKPVYPAPKEHLEKIRQISFAGEDKQIKKTEAKTDTDIQSLPADVAITYKNAQNMLQDVSDTAKEAMQTGIEVQRTAKEAKERAKEVSSSYEGKVPARVSFKNEDGSEDILFFTNGILSAYRKNERKEGDVTKIDKILVFHNEKIASYKEKVKTTANKGSAKKDIEIDKSLEYEGISVTYKQGFKSTISSAAQTNKTVRLILGKPWYFEEGITEKHKEKPGTIKRRLEFSNRERTTYSYQENIRLFDDTKLVKKALYVEDNIPYRYCEDESFKKSSLNMFNSYEYKKLLCLVNGRWQAKGAY